MTWGRARERPQPRLVQSAAEPWRAKGQLARNSCAAFLRCQTNQGQQDGIANQARLARKAEPDSRKGERRAARKSWWAAAERHTTLFISRLNSLPGGPQWREEQCKLQSKGGGWRGRTKKGKEKDTCWGIQSHETQLLNFIMLTIVTSAFIRTGPVWGRHLKEERIRTRIRRKTLNYVWALSTDFYFLPVFPRPTKWVQWHLKGPWPERINSEFQPFNLSLSTTHHSPMEAWGLTIRI